jgi:hypothetical protein
MWRAATMSVRQAGWSRSDSSQKAAGKIYGATLLLAISVSVSLFDSAVVRLIADGGLVGS